MNPKKKIPLGTVIYVSIFLFLMTWAIFEIIKHNRPSINSFSKPTFSKPINPEDYMTFEQRQEADLIVDIPSWERIVLFKPKELKVGSSFSRYFTRDQFPQVLSENDIVRDFAVISLSKGNVPKEYKNYGAALDDMEEFFLGQKFKRVVILTSYNIINRANAISGAWFTILRDSEKKQKKDLK